MGVGVAFNLAEISLVVTSLKFGGNVGAGKVVGEAIVVCPDPSRD